MFLSSAVEPRSPSSKNRGSRAQRDSRREYQGRVAPYVANLIQSYEQTETGINYTIAKIIRD